MAKKGAEAFEVACPCCGAMMKVDPGIRAVISHTPPPTKRTFESLNDGLSALKEQESRRESMFKQSFEAEKNKADILSKKFEEAFKKAKDAPVEKPIRDFDLD
jgi:hypothetical protein